MPDLHLLLDELRHAYETWGYPIVFLGAMLENTILLGLILPGGTLVMLGAVYAHDGSMSLPLVLVLAFLGMVTGTSLDYALGRLGLHSAIGHTRFAARLEPRLAQAEQFLERWGAWAFVLAHFIGHVRSFLAITAGMTQLPLRRFLLYEAPAALIWNLVFVGVGYTLGGNLDRLQNLMGRAGIAVAVAALLVYGVYRILRRLRTARHVQSPDVHSSRALTPVSDGRPSVMHGAARPASRERSPRMEDSMNEPFDDPLGREGTTYRRKLRSGDSRGVTCHQCDAAVDDDDRFCPECGSQFDAVERGPTGFASGATHRNRRH
jgi:membrane protein DedA with SNARE-associated domain